MKRHLKRLNMPRTWKLPRKENKYIIRPNPGKPLDLSLPVLTLLRDILGVVSTAKEARLVINEGKIFINHKKVLMPEQTVGMFDILSFTDKHYQLIINEKNQLSVKEINEADSKTITTKIIGKTTLKKNKLQLTLLNGYNILVDKDEYQVGDTVVVNIPKFSIKTVKELKKGSKVFVYQGNHPAKVGTVEDLKGNVITIKTDKEVLSTLKEYAIAI